MRYVAIDTSGKNLTVIIHKDGKYFTEYDAECGVNHSVALMPKLQELCEKADFDLSTADFFACAVGAGSFTGIRIGVATIKAMCFAFNKPCLSITSFDTLAYNVDGKVMAVIDAKHNGYYVCGYDDGKVVFEPSYVMRDKLEELAKEYSLVSSTPLDGFEYKIVSVADGLMKAVEKKVDKVSSDVETLAPLYVRKSQAEEGR